jgi:hypothetical protein
MTNSIAPDMAASNSLLDLFGESFGALGPSSVTVVRRFNFLRSFRKYCHLIRGFNNHLAAAHELNRAVARGQVQFECRLIPKEVPDSAVVHREQQVHSVIVLHVVADDDYWPLPHCRILSSRVVPVPVYQFPCVLLSLVTVSLPALNLADQPEARYSRRYRTLLARSFALVPIADTRLARLCAAT